jgi:hypothetical protein
MAPQKLRQPASVWLAVIKMEMFLESFYPKHSLSIDLPHSAMQGGCRKKGPYTDGR